MALDSDWTLVEAPFIGPSVARSSMNFRCFYERKSCEIAYILIEYAHKYREAKDFLWFARFSNK